MGVAAENKTRFRYPGTKFFEASQHDIFYGRKQETLELIQAIKAYDIFVVFADSGIGKTSLLNAGLIPELVQENILPVQFRFQDTGMPPLKVIAKKLSEYLNETNATMPALELKLWQLFKRCHFAGKLPLLIFDQFEEFFNHAKQDREDCITELADLLNEYLPDYIKEEMKQKFMEADPTEEEMKYYTPARVKMLFLIRADKLKLLDDLSKKIPLILRNRFHLKPLNASQAEEAILEPAHLPPDGFASPQFEIQPSALKAISNYLKNDEGEVEGFQLQILTQELEKRIIRRREKEGTENNLLITEQELGGEVGLDSITKNYYTRQLASISDKHTRKKAVELIEEKLIVEERRISLPEVLLIKEGFARELLDYLLNATRLIRIDNDRYVEISHDRLLPSILKSRAQRKTKEKGLKRNLIFFTVALLLVALFVFSLSKRDNNYDLLEEANVWKLQQEYGKADTALDKTTFAIFDLSFRDTLKRLRQEINSLMKQKQRYVTLSNQGDSVQLIADALQAKGDSLLAPVDKLDTEELHKKNALKDFTHFETGDLQLMEAWNRYKSAQATGFEPIKSEEKVEPKLTSLSDKISDCFSQYMNAIYYFETAGNTQKAKDLYPNAKSLFDFANANGIELKAENTADYLQHLKPTYQQ